MDSKRVLDLAPGTARLNMNLRFLPESCSGTLVITDHNVPAIPGTDSIASSRMESRTLEISWSTMRLSPVDSHADTAPGSPPTAQYSRISDSSLPWLDATVSEKGSESDSARPSSPQATRNSSKDIGCIGTDPGTVPTRAHAQATPAQSPLAASLRTLSMTAGALSRLSRTIRVLSVTSVPVSLPISDTILTGCPTDTACSAAFSLRSRRTWSGKNLSANLSSVWVFPQPWTPSTTSGSLLSPALQLSRVASMLRNIRLDMHITI